MNLTEATMLALQGKLNLNENKSVKAESRHLLPSQKKLIKQFIKDTNAGKEPEWYDLMKRLEELNDYETLNQDAERYKNDIELEESKKVEETKKTESIDINVDDSTTVSVDDTQTIVNTEDASIIIQEETPDTIEVPVESDDTIVPEKEPEATDLLNTDTDTDTDTIIDTDTVDVPVEEPSNDAEELSTPEEDLDLPMDNNKNEIEENKKVEGYIIKINKDGIDGYWGPQSDAINNNNNVDRLSARIFKSRGAAQREINRYKHEMGNAQIEEIEENKKVESVVRDGAEQIKADDRYDNNLASVNGILADKIANITEDLGDDYSEFIHKEEILEIIDTIVISSLWNDFNNQLDDLIKETIISKVYEIRGDSNDIDESKQAKRDKEDILKNKKEESKEIKQEDVKIEISDDGKEIEVTTDNEEEVEVKNEIKDTEDEEIDTVDESKEIKQEAPRKTRDVYVLMGNYGYGWDELVTYDNYSDAKEDYKTYEENEPEAQHKIVRKREPIEESKKTESVVSDAANSIDYDHRQNPSESNAIPFFAGVISDIAEDMGDDYSEWLGEDAVREIINTLFDNDQLWSTITDIVKDAITAEVEEIRGVPGEEVEESKPVINKFSSKSFNEALTKYFKKIDKTVESVTETKIRKSNKAIKIETKLIKTDKTSETIKLEMKHVETNGDFSRYNLVENTSLKTESKHSNVSMLLHTNKQQVLECRYIISK